MRSNIEGWRPTGGRSGIEVGLGITATGGSQPAPAPAAAAQPAATQPATELQQKLEDLQKQMNLLQEEIAALKAENTPAMKTAALTQPASEPVGLANPPAATDAAPKISISSLLGPVTLSGFGDVYYGYDANHPGNNQSGLRFFEAPTNGFSFNMAELILDKPPDASSPDSRLGYHVAAGYGQAAKIINGSDAPFSDGSNFFLKEAYLSYLAPVGKGLTITVGKFVTNAGDEVIESNANWNYSRSILFLLRDSVLPFRSKGVLYLQSQVDRERLTRERMEQHSDQPCFRAERLQQLRPDLWRKRYLHSEHEMVRGRELLWRTGDHRGES